MDSLARLPNSAKALLVRPPPSSISCSCSRASRYWEVARMLPKCFISAPTLREMDISLSFSTMTMGSCWLPM